MELAIYIKNLLYNYDSVIIPELGSFQTKYKAAEINPSENTITPPSKFLVFEDNVHAKDGLLIHFIATQKKTDVKSAEEFVKDQVESIILKLDAGETIFLEGLGYLSKENGVIRFDREPEANFLTESFGLSKVDYKPVEFDLSPKETAEPITSAPKKRNYVFAAMIFIILLLVGGGIAVYLYYPDITQRLKKFYPRTSAVIKSQKTDTTKAQADTSKQNDLENFFDKSTDKKNALALTKDTLNSAPKEEDVNYYIIAGSFKTFAKANILAKQLEKEKYKPEVIQFEEDLFRVSLGEYKDKAQALTNIEKIKALKGKDAVWLLKKKI